MVSLIPEIKKVLLRVPVLKSFLRFLWKHYVTSQCIQDTHDCKAIPKVENAGNIFKDPTLGYYQIMHNGIKIKTGYYLADFNSSIITFLRGHQEPQEECVFYHVLNSLPEDMIMIEIGSYWGYYSMWAKKSKSRAENYLIDCLDENLTAGKNNFTLNGMSGHFTKACISKKRAERTLSKTPQITLDDFIEEHCLPFVHIVHADIQGAELDMLKGAEKSIFQKKIGYFFISTHSEYLHNKCKSFLVRNDFAIVASHTKKESFSTDGLICARLKNFSGLKTVTIRKKRTGIFKDLLSFVKYLFTNLRA